MPRTYECEKKIDEAPQLVGFMGRSVNCPKSYMISSKRYPVYLFYHWYQFQHCCTCFCMFLLLLCDPARRLAPMVPALHENIRCGCTHQVIGYVTETKLSATQPITYTPYFFTYSFVSIANSCIRQSYRRCPASCEYVVAMRGEAYYARFYAGRVLHAV